MEVSSLELSRELFELSGWGQTYWAWVIPSISMSRALPFVAENKVAKGIDDETLDSICPAYSAGYLLRRLPSHIWSNQYEQNAYLWTRKDSDKYCAWYKVADIKYGEDITSEHGAVCETPEDALAKLAISLIKSGIIIGNEETSQESRTNQDG